MKIIWIDDQREIPGVGILNTGDIRDIPEEKAMAYISQGQATHDYEPIPDMVEDKGGIE
jgi:hypothetical protein